MALEVVEQEIFRSLLEELRVKISSKKDKVLRTIVEENSQLREQVLDEGDKSGLNSRMAVNVGLNEELSQTLVKIREATRRIDQGVFGDCIECTRPISLARLGTVPYEGLCAECKNSEEQKLGRTRSSELIRESAEAEELE